MNIAAKIKDAQREPDVDGFARDLSDLCRRYGVGLTGTPTLFVMERDDYQLRYEADHDGNLRLR